MKFVKRCENKIFLIQQKNNVNLDSFLTIHFFNNTNTNTNKHIKKGKR